MPLTKVRTPPFLVSLIQPVMIRKVNKNLEAFYRNLYLESLKRPSHCVIDSEEPLNPKLCPTFTVLYRYPADTVAEDTMYLWFTTVGRSADPLNVTLLDVALPYGGPKCSLGAFIISKVSGQKKYYTTCGRDGGKSVLVPRTDQAVLSVYLVTTMAGPKPWYVRYAP